MAKNVQENNPGNSAERISESGPEDEVGLKFCFVRRRAMKISIY